MKKIDIITKFFLLFVGIAFLSIAVQALFNPQIIMDFVSIKLDNISARNSIRAYYGGVNFVFAFFLIYGAFNMRKEALLFVSIYGTGFVIGRIYSIIVEGMPSAFILSWLAIESILTLIAVGLMYYKSKQR